MKTGELLIVSRDDAGAVTAAAHLLVTMAQDHAEVLIAAGAVHVDARGRGGRLADALMAECRRVAAQLSAERSTMVVLVGRIHVANRPSQLMASRAGFEPVGPPSGSYQDWVLPIEPCTIN